MVEADDANAHDEAMTFPDLGATLTELDMLEGYRPHAADRSLYLRCVQPITLTETGKTVPTYCYVWQGALPAGVVPVPSGRWRRHLWA